MFISFIHEIFPKPLAKVQTLVLGNMCEFDADDLKILLTLLPVLTNSKMTFYHSKRYSKTIAIDEMIDIISQGIRLEHLTFSQVSNLKIDRTAHEHILNSIQNCQMLNIPNHIQEANCQRLRIIHESHDCDCNQEAEH